MFSSHLHTFGLDISDRSIKLAAVRSNFHGHLAITQFGREGLGEGIVKDGEIVNHAELTKAFQTLLSRMSPPLDTRYVTLALPESKTFIKVIEVTATEPELTRAILEELPNHIPLPLSDLIIDWQENGIFEDRKMVTIGAVPKSITESYTTFLEGLALRPVAYEIEAQGIVRSIEPLSKCRNVEMSKFRALDISRLTKRLLRKKVNQFPGQNNSALPPPPAKLIVDLGATRTSMILFDWDTIQFTSSVALSGTDATKAVAERLHLTEPEAERAKRICGLNAHKCKGVVAQVLAGMLSQLAIEIERAVTFYRSHFPRSHPVQEVILTGGGSSLIGAEEYLASQISLPIRLGNPLLNLTSNSERYVFPKREALSFTTAIGLALREYGQS